MRVLPVFLLGALLSANACSRPANARQYELQGQILGIERERSEVVIRHEDIKGFMPGMTMTFKVPDAQLLAGKEPGDLVTATLVVEDVEAYLTALTRTGHAAIETPPAVASAPKILAPGEPVSDALLIDQDEAPRPFSAFRGHRVAVTFIYTRCPLAEYCPLMDRHFAAVQKAIKSTPGLSDVRLLTVTLDPAFDTPKILKAHAARRGADHAVWSFVTGEPTSVGDFASQFGLYVERADEKSADITHNLRTAVVDAEGRLVKAYSGNDWTPAQLVADLEKTPAPRN
jgi:protein SCO1/2